MANVLEFVIKCKDEASAQLGGVGGMLGDIGKIASGVALGNMIPMIGEQLLGLVTDAAGLEEVRTSFASLVKDTGEDAGDYLAELKKMSGGQLTEAEIMKQANRALILSGADVADKLPMMMRIAETAADATGESFEGMLSALVEGIGKIQPRALARVGIVIKDEQKVFDQYAKTVGKLPGQLTDADKAQALWNITLERAEERFGDLETVVPSTADKMETFKAKVGDLGAKVGTALLPVLDTLVQDLLNVSEGHYDTADAMKAAGREADSLHGEFVDLILREQELAELDKETRKAMMGGWQGVQAAMATTLSAEEMAIKKQAAALLGEAIMPKETAEQAKGMVETLIRDTVDPRIVGARQAMEAEETAGDESIANLDRQIKEKEILVADAQKRLEETRAGLHGAPGAYDPYAITAETVEGMERDLKNLHTQKETLELGHQGRMADLQKIYADSIGPNTTDPALKRMAQYYTDAETMAEIRSKNMAIKVADGYLPTLTEQLVPELISKALLPESLEGILQPEQVKEVIGGIGKKWDDVREAVDTVYTKTDAARKQTETGAPAMGNTIKTNIIDRWATASTAIETYTKTLGGIPKDIYVTIHQQLVTEGEPGPGVTPPTIPPTPNWPNRGP